MIAVLKNNAVFIFFISAIAAVIFIPFIGYCPLFDWDEVNFAECAREMVTSHNYSLVQLNYRPFWEKPPLFIWMQAASMNVFGINEFAARLPNAICSLVSLVSLFVIGVRFHSQKFGVLWALIYAATLLPHLYFKSGLIDPWFNLFIFLALYHCLQFLNPANKNKAFIHALSGGLLLGLAVLTKGPVAILVVALTVLSFLIWSKQLRLLLSFYFILFVVTTLFISGSWFLIEYLRGNGELLFEFINYQIRLLETGDSGHDGPFFYHFVVLLLGCFPASLIFIISYSKFNHLSADQKLHRKLMVCLFWVVIILFSIVKTKIVHYSSLCYFPLSFIATLGIVKYFSEIKFNLMLKILYWFVTIMFSLAFTMVCFIDYFKSAIINSDLIADKFAIENLKANVNWTGFECVIGLIFFTSAWLIFRSIQTNKIKLLYLGITFNLVFICLAILIVVPKVEQYTQHATIEFYKTCAKQKCYVETHGFKSYAYLFYSARQPDDYTNPDQVSYINKQLDLMESEGHSRFTSFPTSNLLWMENGKIDRPAYIVVKNINESELKEILTLKKLYSKNGFSFFVRMPAK